MTALLTKRRGAAASDPAKTLDTLATILIVILTVAILYLAREILVPIAIAILLSFVLSPLVRVLRKIGLGKTLSVGLVVCAGFVVAVGLGAILGKQISDLAGEAPLYQATVTQKIEAARGFATNSPILGKINSMIADVGQGSVAPSGDKARQEPPPAPRDPLAKVEAAKDGAHPPVTAPPNHGQMPVQIVEPAPGVLSMLQKVAGTAASPLATAAFVAIFIVFILMQREDLRNRFIRLVGGGDLQRTTLAMDDAGSRLARYLLAQVLLNLGFGVVVAVALAIIGVPSAILWGIVAMFMRFVPYVGAAGSALFPIVMAAAASPGWGMVIETAILFGVIELLVGQVIEPLVYGHNTGISPIAVVVSATFWTWLWGPVGLVLSTPMTVCLVVLGRHVDRLAFLDVILGNAPALSPVETFYQRMLAGDPSEIVEHADAYLHDHSVLDYCDDVAMKALLLAQEDASRGSLPGDQQAHIRDMMRDLVEDLSDRTDASDKPPKAEDEADKPKPDSLVAIDQAPAAPGEDAVAPEAPPPKMVIHAAWAVDGAVLCLAARTPLDEAAAHLLSDLLRRHGIGARVAPAESVTADDLKAIAAGARLVLLSSLDADLKVAQARFAVRRVRRHAPDVPIAVGFWMAEQDEKRMTGLCSDVRCDTCVANLPAAIQLCLERAGQSRDEAREHEKPRDGPD